MARSRAKRRPSREAWRRLFPTITLVLCFLHSILKIKDRCTVALRHQVLDRAWQVYQATTKRQFAQRLRRLAEWTPTHRSGAVAEMVLQRCRRRADFTTAYDGPQAHRTSQAVDRRLNSHDRRLDAMRYGHATTASARLAVRAMALQGNLHLYGSRLRRDQPSRVSPFHDLNGFQYYPNWLHNLLIAYSTDVCHPIHGKVALNPREACHPVHVKAATWTTGRLPPNPGEACHHRSAATLGGSC